MSASFTAKMLDELNIQAPGLEVGSQPAFPIMRDYPKGISADTLKFL